MAVDKNGCLYTLMNVITYANILNQCDKLHSDCRFVIIGRIFTLMDAFFLLLILILLFD